MKPNNKLEKLKEAAIIAGKEFARCEVDYFNALSEDLMNRINQDIKNGIRYKIFEPEDEMPYTSVKEVLEVLDCEKSDYVDNPLTACQLQLLLKVKYKTDNWIYVDDICASYIIKY